MPLHPNIQNLIQLFPSHSGLETGLEIQPGWVFMQYFQYFCFQNKLVERKHQTSPTVVFQNFPSSAWKLWSSSKNCEIQPRKIKIIPLYICLTFNGLWVVSVYSAHCASYIISVESSKQPCGKGIFSFSHRILFAGK